MLCRFLCLLLASWAFAHSAHAQAETVSDSDLSQHLIRIYRAADGLDNIEVTVNAGVVRLGGSVLNKADKQRAEKLAADVDGVVEVEDDIELSSNVSERIFPAWQLFKERFSAIVYQLPVFLIGLLILVVSWWFAGWISSRNWLFGRLTGNLFLREIVSQLVRTAIMLIASLFVLDLLGLTAMVGAVLGAAGVATLAIGFAFRDLIENYIASLLLSLRQPFKPDDLIRVGEHEGRVSRLNSRATILITPDGNHVRIPNAIIFKSIMVNYSRNPGRRLQFGFGIESQTDLQQAQSLAETALVQTEGVLAEPPPACLISQLADSSVKLTAYAWVDQASHDFGRVCSEAIRQVKDAFAGAGIVMPDTTFNVRVSKKAPAADHPVARVEQSSRLPLAAQTRGDDPISKTVHSEMTLGQNLLDDRAKAE
jgi:small conductance mechanosensitive channel